MKVNQIIKSMGLVALCFAAVACNKSQNEPDQPTTPTDSTETPVDSIVKPIVKSGEFSVSDSTIVLFAPGNLEYQASTKTYRFAANQYDTIGNGNANISDSYDGWIDLFGWGTGANPTLCIGEGDTTDYETFYAEYVDWGTNKIDDYEANTWRTLTNDEWNYVLFTRTNAAKLHGGATINGVKGWVILPDAWTAPEGITFNPSLENGLVDEYNSGYYYNSKGDSFEHNVYTAEEWAKLEDAGAIFLPMTGSRFKNNYNCYDYNGTYWSSSEYADYTAFKYCFAFDASNFSTTMNDGSNGYAVRLVKNK